MATLSYSTLILNRRLLRQACPYWPYIAGIFLLGLLSTPLALLTPLPLKIAVDSVLSSQPLPHFLEVVLPAAVTRSDSAVLVLAVGLTVAIALLNQLQALASSSLRTYVGEKLVLDFRSRLFRHVQRLSLSYHGMTGTTDSTYRIQYDVPAIQWIMIYGIIPFITAGCTLSGMSQTRARLKFRALTAFLHLLQPLARLCGRLRHGLTPWRHGAPGFALPRPRTSAIWTERWRDPAERLQCLKGALRVSGAAVLTREHLERRYPAVLCPEYKGLIPLLDEAAV